MDEFARRQPSRRTVVAAIGLAPVASLAPSILAESKARAAKGAGYRFFDAHQAAVVKAAAARLVPGPHDDPVEALLGSPGATEADVVRYIDTMLSAFQFARPRIFAGGPWSDRHGGKRDYMKRFVKPAPRQRDAWHRRIKLLRRQYAAAVKALDAAVSTKDFATASAFEQDNALTKLDDVRDLIFGHTVEGMYSVPEYGGNRNLVGWRSISWPGDTQPRGYTPNQVEHGDGEDIVVVSGIVGRVLDALPHAARQMAARGWPRG